MPTLLQHELVREVIVGDQPFKVVLTPEGVRITRKGRRLGTSVTWTALIALTEREDEQTPPNAADGSSMPRAVAGDIAREVRLASDAIARAKDALVKAGTIPSALLAEIADPMYGRREQRDDWYIEPLLTATEVATILRIPKRSVRGFGMRPVMIGAEERYRQSDVRRYISEHQSRF